MSTQVRRTHREAGSAHCVLARHPRIVADLSMVGRSRRAGITDDSWYSMNRSASAGTIDASTTARWSYLPGVG
ncbi:MAG: hypothetical protein IT307_06755 [Chloroflexi bacterium]|nr:hypothetical protein [Chloroflexota bacterium]